MSESKIKAIFEEKLKKIFNFDQLYFLYRKLKKMFLDQTFF